MEFTKLFEKQKQKVREHLPKQDIVVTTALIPGRPAPKLISKDMVEAMKPGAVIVDMAAEAGGNCELTKPGEVTTTNNGVIIDGRMNLPSRLAETASALFAKNLFNFVSPHFDKEKGEFAFDEEDATVEGTMVCKDGKVVSDRVAEALDAKGVKYSVGELDEEADGAAMRCRLGIRTGRTSVPSVWVAGEYLGGLNDGPGLLPLDEQGELEPKLRAAGAL